MIFTSEIIRCNVPNKNGHVYTKECIEKTLENPVIKEQIENGCFFGGFMEDYREDFSIDVSKISHVCKDLWWEDDMLYGKFETLDTPKGRILTEALTSTNIPNMVPTGIGILEMGENGTKIVKDYTILSIDIVKEKT